MKAYGPVPSRRLGRSLGINNIPPKICTYSCVYCQLGRTIEMSTTRTNFYDPSELKKEVEEKIAEIDLEGEDVDYISFVPDGEPTLETNLGEEIELVSELGIEVAVISNASLISEPGVRDDLGKADWVSLKVDAVSESIWHEVDRPAGNLELEDILDGIEAFSDQFDGPLATETMLIDEINDENDEIKKTASFLGTVSPDEAYIAVPTRPPAEDWANPAKEEKINRAYREFSKQVDDVEYLLGYEGNQFSSTGNFQEDILSITAVHPMREEGVQELLRKTESDPELVEELIEEGKLIKNEFEDSVYYMRKLDEA